MSDTNTNLDDSMYMDQLESSYIKDSKDDDVDPAVGQIVSLVEERFKRAEDGRYGDEQRWIKAYRNFRGIYGSDVQFTSTEKSRIFVKITKTKVLAAYGQIVEVLFGNNKFPISIDPTTLPEGIAESVFFESDKSIRDAQQSGAPQGPTEEDTRLRPGETMQDLKERLGGLKKKLEPVADMLQEGEGNSPSSITFHPAMIAAKKMEKKIHDQLEESNSNKQLRNAAF